MAWKPLESIRQFFADDPERDARVTDLSVDEQGRMGRRAFGLRFGGGVAAGVTLNALGPLGGALETFAQDIDAQDGPEFQSTDPVAQYYEATVREYNPRYHTFHGMPRSQNDVVMGVVLERDGGNHDDVIQDIMMQAIPGSNRNNGFSNVHVTRVSSDYEVENIIPALENSVPGGRWRIAGINSSFSDVEPYPGFGGWQPDTIATMEPLNLLVVNSAGNIAGRNDNVIAPGRFAIIAGATEAPEYLSAPENTRLWEDSSGQRMASLTDITTHGLEVPFSGGGHATGTSFSAPQVDAALLEQFSRYGKQVGGIDAFDVLFGFDYDNLDINLVQFIADRIGVDTSVPGWEQELQQFRNGVMERMNFLLTESLLISADTIAVNDPAMLVERIDGLPAYDPNGSGYGRMNISHAEHVTQDTLRLYRIREREGGLGLPEIHVSETGPVTHEGGMALEADTLAFAGKPVTAWKHTLPEMGENISPFDIYADFQLRGLENDQEVTVFVRSPTGTVTPVGIVTGLGLTHTPDVHAFDTSAFLREPTVSPDGQGWEVLLVPASDDISLGHVTINEVTFGARGAPYEQVIHVSPQVAVAHETLPHYMDALGVAVEATPRTNDPEAHDRLYDQFNTARTLQDTAIESDTVVYDYSSSPPTPYYACQPLLEHVVEQLEVLAEFKRQNGEDGVEHILATSDTLFAAMHHSYAYVLDDGHDVAHTQALRAQMTAAIEAVERLDRNVLHDLMAEYTERFEAIYPRAIPGHPDFQAREMERTETMIVPNLEQALDAVIKLNQERDVEAGVNHSQYADVHSR